MKNRQRYMRDYGIVFIKKSGAVCINWKKAVRSSILRKQIKAMSILKASNND